MESIIITVCLLLLIAYVFDISSSKTKIPSVILLLLLGWMVNNGFDFINLSKPDFSKYLPIIGTIGLLSFARTFIHSDLRLVFGQSGRTKTILLDTKIKTG